MTGARLLRAGGALLPVLLSLAPSAAFVRVRNTANGNPLRRTDAAAIAFKVNNLTAAGMANSGGAPIIAAGSNPQGAITGAMNAWTAIPASVVSFEAPGSTADTNASSNGENLITFVDTPANRALVGSDALAVTVLKFNLAGVISDSDIVVSPAKAFSTNNQGGTYDLQSVITHELGHALGAGHSGVVGATR